jgi:chitinase
MYKKIFSIIIPCFLIFFCSAQQTTSFNITGYYAGSAERLDSFPLEKLTHIIYSFGHLKGNKLHINNAKDSACIKKMVAFKGKHPKLKVILSLGGWGGCKECPNVFSTDKGRKEFAASVKQLSEYFKTDGIDLDWEYPAIPGHPGHPYSSADKGNFTLLVSSLRQTLGNNYEISFAAGGFDQFIDSSIDWKEVMPLIDKVYVMTYDLVHGYSTTSGHHTPLYPTPQQTLSADHAIKRIMDKGVPANKVVIGAAFYGRMFKVEDTLNNGLYRPSKFLKSVSYRNINDTLSTNGFKQYWDPVAHAPYAFNPGSKIFVTWDDTASIKQKTKYAIENRLGGIMFWQLAEDKFQIGLLGVIYETMIEEKKKK